MQLDIVYGFKIFQVHDRPYEILLGHWICAYVRSVPIQILSQAKTYQNC